MSAIASRIIGCCCIVFFFAVGACLMLRADTNTVAALTGAVTGVVVAAPCSAMVTWLVMRNRTERASETRVLRIEIAQNAKTGGLRAMKPAEGQILHAVGESLRSAKPCLTAGDTRKWSESKNRH